jgi:golgi phosphoprotein 3
MNGGHREITMQASLPEELLLLALHDEKGSVIPSAARVLNGALIGAVLMELGLLGRLREAPDGALLAEPAATGNEIMDEVSRWIAEADRPRMPSYWVGRLAGRMPRLKDRLLEQLVSRGILERRERRILWVFPSRSFPLADAAAEQKARDRIRAVILESRVPDQRTAALIGLVRACNLIDEIFAPHERPQAHRRIGEMTGEEAATGGILGSGLDAVLMAAVLGATILYSHQMLNRPDDDTDWDFSSPAVWDTNWSEPSSETDTGAWDGGSVSDDGWGGDSGGGDSGGGDAGGSSC